MLPCAAARSAADQRVVRLRSASLLRVERVAFVTSGSEFSHETYTRERSHHPHPGRHGGLHRRHPRERIDSTARGDGASSVAASYDDRALRSGRHRRRPHGAARERATSARAARRRRAHHGRALSPPGLVRQRGPARIARASDRRGRRRRRCAALLPDQQGPVVAPRSPQAVCPRCPRQARVRQLLPGGRHKGRDPEVGRFTQRECQNGSNRFLHDHPPWARRPLHVRALFGRIPGRADPGGLAAA